MYNHDNFDDEALDQGYSPVVSLGECLIIHGLRSNPQIITISPKAQIDPIRDARILATLLSSTLMQDTLIQLSQLLFNEWVLPSIDKSIFSEGLKQVEKRAKQKARKEKEAKLDKSTEPSDEADETYED